jgi:hypothetical protein
MVGVNSHAVPALPLDRVVDLVERCTPAELRARP